MSAEVLRQAAALMRSNAETETILRDPVVLLAVADWLDKFADLYEASKHRERPVFGDYEHALAVARAYLGDNP